MNPKNSNPKFTGERHIFHYTFLFDAYDVFIGRYFFSDSIREVAGYYGMSESKAKSMLYRTRIGLKKYLEQEGFFDET